MIKDDEEIICPGFCLRPPYSTELFALCERLDEEFKLNNGPTALYWHLQPIFGIHLKNQSE